MSYCAHVRTITKLKPDELFKKLANQSEKIIVTSSEFPVVKFGTYKYALRGLEVSTEEDGFEVRICAMASMADYQLFPKVVVAVQELTGGVVYSEEDDEKPLKDPKKYFGLKWRRQQTEGSWRITCALVKENNEPVVFEGIFFPFVVGPKMLAAFEINLDDPTGGEDYKRLEHHLFSVQWALDGLINTATRLALPSPDGESKPLGISLISLKNGKVDDFDYISYAEIICFMNRDTEETAMTRFKYLDKILVPGKFQIIDEEQYVKTEDITVEDFNQMLRAAKELEEDDFFKK